MPVNHIAHRYLTQRFAANRNKSASNRSAKSKKTRQPTSESWTPPGNIQQLVLATNQAITPASRPPLPPAWPQNAFSAALMTLSTLSLVSQLPETVDRGTTLDVLADPHPATSQPPLTLTATASVPAPPVATNKPEHPGKTLTFVAANNQNANRYYGYQLASPQRSMLNDGTRQINAFYRRYDQLHPSLHTQAVRLLREGIKRRFGLDIDPDKTWFIHFNGGVSSDKTITGWQHATPPLESGTLTSYLFRNFPASAQENLNGLNNQCGLYRADPQLTHRFDEHNEVPILPADFVRLVWDIDFYNQALAQYRVSYRDPQSHIQRAYLDLIMNLTSRQPARETVSDILMGAGLLKNNGIQVHRFDINGYQASNMLVFSNTHTGRVTLYMPNHEQKFLAFRSLFEMRSWIVNNCADARHRQAIASHFSLAERQNGLLYYGVDSWLQSLYQDINDGSYLDRIATRGDALEPAHFFELFSRLEQARRLADLDTLVKSDAEVRRDIWEQELDASLLLANPASLLLSFATHLEHALEGDSWQERQQEWAKMVSDVVNIALMTTMERMVTFTEQGIELVNGVRTSLQARSPEGIIDTLFTTSREALTAENARRLLPTARQGGFTRLSDELMQSLDSLPGAPPAAVKKIQPDNDGLYHWRDPQRGSMRHALVAGNRLYELSPLEIKDCWQLENGQQIALLDDGWYLRGTSNSLDIAYTPCRTRRAPGEGCVHFSLGLDDLLRTSLEKGRPLAELGVVKPHPTYPALLVNSKGKLFLNYHDTCFRVKPEITDDEFTLYPAKSSALAGLVKQTPLARFTFSRKSGYFYLNTPVENTMEVMGCSRSAAELYHFALANRAKAEALSGEEYFALRAYASNDFDVINDFMLQGMPAEYLVPHLRRQIADRVLHIRTALKKLPSWQGTVYRGGALDPELLAALKPGDIVTSKKFISTSVDTEVAKLFTVEKTHPVFYRFDLKKAGHPINLYTMHLQEAEVLIEDGTLFQCAAVNGNEIYLQELASISPAQAEQVKVLPL